MGRLLSWHKCVHTFARRKGRGHSASVCIRFGGALILTTGAWALWKTQGFKLYQSAKGQEVANVKATNAQYVISFQLVLIAASVALVYDTTQSLKQKTGLPVVNQILSWIVLGVSSAIPFLYGLRSNHHFLQRLTVICLAFSPTIILLSISYETLFYYFFCVTVLLWMLIERRLYAAEDLQPGNNAVRTLKARDARTALTFLFFINVAFFGTGNVASLSSFSLESVYRLTTVFNPFLWGALLIAKILIPFFVVSAVLGVLARSLDLPAFSLFLIVLSVTDVQTLNFFFLVRDDGSWLEIGTSISHFCISEMFLIFTILLFWLSHLLVGRAVVTREGQKTVSTGVNDNTLSRKDKIA
ncbi:Phosphatidylinositolglycan class N-domain-containing protein [Jimgerdemannia flammicorona]|uniref:GPI ethanolamine phosphate transferase 1 n=1 Tax=Jimgerdemannia flammicorona TaxID=994334 RepID=A0A433CWH3_9FUNG|nr:Phosphatidylinositolglycan class N-domain-containing protein [Jimgerdemannia flammicorona]